MPSCESLPLIWRHTSRASAQDDDRSAHVPDHGCRRVRERFCRRQRSRLAAAKLADQARCKTPPGRTYGNPANIPQRTDRETHAPASLVRRRSRWLAAARLLLVLPCCNETRISSPGRFHWCVVWAAGIVTQLATRQLGVTSCLSTVISARDPSSNSNRGLVAGHRCMH